jgi:hypothetical protein
VYLPLFETLISFPLTLYLLVGSDPTSSTLAVTCSNLVFYGELSRIFWTKILLKEENIFALSEGFIHLFNCCKTVINLSSMFLICTLFDCQSYRRQADYYSSEYCESTEFCQTNYDNCAALLKKHCAPSVLLVIYLKVIFQGAMLLLKVSNDLCRKKGFLIVYEALFIMSLTWENVFLWFLFVFSLGTVREDVARKTIRNPRYSCSLTSLPLVIVVIILMSIIDFLFQIVCAAACFFVLVVFNIPKCYLKSAIFPSSGSFHYDLFSDLELLCGSMDEKCPLLPMFLKRVVYSCCEFESIIPTTAETKEKLVESFI